MANPEGSGSSPPPNQDPTNPTSPENESSTPRGASSTRRARISLRLSLGPSGQRRPLVQPEPEPHQYLIWPHLEARVAPPPLPLPPPIRRRGGRTARAPSMPLIMPNYPWKCRVCGTGFFNMRSLSGHMSAHKDRGWRGINPPPEFCKPKPRPLPGLRIGGSPHGNYNNYRPRTGLNLGVTSSFGWRLSGLGLGRMQQMAFPRRVPPQAQQSGNMPIDQGQGQNEEVVLNRRERLGKNPMYPEEGGTSESAKRSKRSKEGLVPDLNSSPPGPDEADDGDAEEADGDAAA